MTKRASKAEWRKTKRAIGAALGDLRVQHKLTHRELAALCGKSPGASFRWISGRGMPTLWDLILIARGTKGDLNKILQV